MSQKESNMLCNMKLCVLEEAYHLLDIRFKKNEIPRFYDFHIGISINNAYDKLFRYGEKFKIEYIDNTDIDF